MGAVGGSDVVVSGPPATGRAPEVELTEWTPRLTGGGREAAGAEAAVETSSRRKRRRVSSVSVRNRTVRAGGACNTVGELVGADAGVSASFVVAGGFRWWDVQLAAQVEHGAWRAVRGAGPGSGCRRHA